MHKRHLYPAGRILHLFPQSALMMGAPPAEADQEEDEQHEGAGEEGQSRGAWGADGPSGGSATVGVWRLMALHCWGE